MSDNRSTAPTARKPSTTGRLIIPILRRGTKSATSSPNPGEAPLVFLRVQIISCKGLEAKDRNGKSDPFVVVSIWGKQFQTPVCKRDLNPKYEPEDATFSFPIYDPLMHEPGTLKFVVWDKDLIKNDYMGEYSLPVNQWFKGTAFAFDDPNNEPFSISLVSARSTKPVPGTMLIKVGFHLPDSTRQQDFGGTYNALIASSNPKVGTVMVDINNAKDLPKWSNMISMGYDMDPFVEVSIGKETLCTRVIQHTLNPVWNQQLFFHVRQDDLSLPIRLTVFDRDKLTRNDYVGEAEVTIPTFNGGAAVHDRVPLRRVNKPGPEYDPTPTITFHFTSLNLTLNSESVVITKLHEFVNETRYVLIVAISLITFPPDPTQLYLLTPNFYLMFIAHHEVTPEEWMTAIKFLTHTGQTCTPLYQEFVLLLDMLGMPMSALVDALNNPLVSAATESSVLGLFFTEDAPDVIRREG
ncbi:C2 domain-containing protein [Lactarius indigo]|nr:C2 domain-containing protein [Lactarius indigo]